MDEPARRHRLDGLEPDNLLAFLALLGLLRALEAVCPAWQPRAAWDLDRPPLRPVLIVAEAMRSAEICRAAAQGVSALVAEIDFSGATDLKLEVPTARSLGQAVAERAADSGRYFADLVAALISDAATDREHVKVEPTPLAYPSVATSNFLRNLLELSRKELPEKRSGKSYPRDSAACMAQALFAPWQRRDRPVGLRWDPDEAKRHALQWRAPTKDLPTTQHGASRLAIVGLSALTAAPARAGAQHHLSVIGGKGTGDRFSIAWPIWAQPASLTAIRALLSHPDLREPRALQHLGVDHIRVARRISLDRLRSFTHAEPANP